MKAFLVAVIVTAVVAFILFVLALARSASLDKYSRELEDRDQMRAIREYNEGGTQKKAQPIDKVPERICALRRI